MWSSVIQVEIPDWKRNKTTFEGSKIYNKETVVGTLSLTLVAMELIFWFSVFANLWNG